MISLLVRSLGRRRIVDSVKEYKWFGKPHTSLVMQLVGREGGVGFLVHDCLVNEVYCYSVQCECVDESVRGEGKISLVCRLFVYAY